MDTATDISSKMPLTGVSTQIKNTYDVGINYSSNVTVLTEGPYVDAIRHNQLYVLMPSIVYTSVLMLVGMPGNFIVMLVYLLKMAKTTSRHFIISLAICDFINCGFGMPVELGLLFNFFNFDYPILCKISRFCNFFMNNVSSLILVGIAVDRFRRVCLPLRPNMTVTQSKVMCICFGIISMISALPAFYIYGTRTIIKPIFDNFTHIQLKTCHVDDTAGDTIPLVFSLYLFFCIILMFLSMTIMYALIARVVCGRKHMTRSSFTSSKYKDINTVTADQKTINRTRFSTRFLKSFADSSPKMHGRRSPRNPSPLPDVTEPLAPQNRSSSETSVRRHGGKEIRAGRTTMMLFIVTLVFVLSFVPFLVIVTIRYIDRDAFNGLSPAYSSLYHFTLRSYLLNSAVNPLIYCFLNRQFRLKVKLFFCRKCAK